MPRYVDADQRKSDILNAAALALSEEGYGRLSLRSLARRMGGSSTLVTHYFPTKEDLIVALIDRVLEESAEMEKEIRKIEDPFQRAKAALYDFLPDADDSLRQESVRVALVPYKETDPAIARLFELLEPSMRSVIRTGLEGAVPDQQLDAVVDLVRVWTSGMALSAVEHPEIWTPERQRTACDGFMALLPIHTTPELPA